MLWPSLRPDFKLTFATFLLQASSPTAERGEAKGIRQSQAIEFLRSVDIPSDILATFLDGLLSHVQQHGQPSPQKRRRVSYERASSTISLTAEDSDSAFKRLAFVLELVDSSKPSFHAGLMDGLFRALGELQRFRSEKGSELAYLQTLVLGTLLSMVEAYKVSHHCRHAQLFLDTNKYFQHSSTHKLEDSVFRTDLIVDCVRSSSSRQVQNAALLLVARVASIAPDLVLRNIMPIFTFVGPIIIQQDDDFSAYVLSEVCYSVHHYHNRRS
jgi:U3 small nucleolar RNA-associated protein 10